MGDSETGGARSSSRRPTECTPRRLIRMNQQRNVCACQLCARHGLPRTLKFQKTNAADTILEGPAATHTTAPHPRRPNHHPPPPAPLISIYTLDRPRYLQAQGRVPSTSPHTRKPPTTGALVKCTARCVRTVPSPLHHAARAGNVTFTSLKAHHPLQHQEGIRSASAHRELLRSASAPSSPPLC